MNAADPNDLLDAAIDHLLEATAEVQTAVAGFSSNLARRAAPTALASSPRRFLAYCALMRLMRAHDHFFAAASSVMVIQTPRDWPGSDFEYASDIGILGGGKGEKKIKTLVHPSRTKKGSWDFSPSGYLDAQKLLVFIPAGAELHPELAVSADTVVKIDVLCDRHLDSLARQLNAGPLSESDKEFLRDQDPSFIDSIFRRGRSASAALAKLRDMASSRTGSRVPVPLSHFGAAGLWAVRLLIATEN